MTSPGPNILLNLSAKPAQYVAMAKKYAGRAVFYKLEANRDNRDLGKELGIKVVPTFFIYKNGGKVAEMTGAKADKARAKAAAPAAAFLGLVADNVLCCPAAGGADHHARGLGGAGYAPLPPRAQNRESIPDNHALLPFPAPSSLL